MKLKWTYDKCKEEALKYSTKIEFKSNCSSAYQVARINNWLNDICSHMILIGHKYKRCIYSFEFSNNYVYVGLTYNINKRKNEHFTDKNSQVYKYFQKIKIIPKFNQLTDYLDLEIARQEEDNFIQKYLKDGWNILNKNKAGVIGSSKIFYTKEKCQEIALNYSKSSDFAKNHPSAYSAAKKHNWLNDIYSHMKKINHSPGYWTKENCHIEALKYKTRTEYAKNNMTSYNKARKEKWLNDICDHML